MASILGTGDAYKTVHTQILYKGKPLDECSREELIEMIEYLLPFKEKWLDQRNVLVRSKGEIQMMKEGVL